MSNRSTTTRLPWLAAGVAAVGVGAAVLRPRRPKKPAAYRDTAMWRLYNGASAALDRRVGWDRLPTPIGFLVLVGLRNILRQHNLHDAGPGTARPTLPPDHPSVALGRSPDGSFNDPDDPRMGMAGALFGRNVPPEETWPEPEEDLLQPNPRVVSRELLARREFVPAETLNLLAAAWIQFMVKDWFSHGKGVPEQRWEIPLADDDPWPQRPFTILKTLPYDGHDGDGPPSFVNTSTHWWDGSQLYGSSIEEQRERRTHDGGKLRIGPEGLLVLRADPRKSPAMVPGWWAGLNMMATLFIREHNAVCERLQEDNPRWSDEELFQRARLIVSALLAKIHTVEWTPAIIAHPTTVAGLKASWWGLGGEQLRRRFGHIGSSDMLSGIPGSDTDHYGVPYSLTEEFTIVYRMHPLIPDDYVFRAAADDGELFHRTLQEISGPGAQDLTNQAAMADLFYTFGTSHPGAIVLHNFPNTLLQFRRPDADVLMDIGAIDILRTRELGVPRYNRFRQLLHMRPVRSFEELTGGDLGLAEEIRRVYEGDIDRVDVIVGMFAEPRPTGFAFSDTAFRIFLLMAARRLNSDRFLTRDFTTAVYTRAGMDWVQGNTMASVVRRHYPELGAVVQDNAFLPWTRTAARKAPALAAP